jgi:hypothetical protein
MTQSLKYVVFLVAILFKFASPVLAVPVSMNTIMHATYSGIVIHGTDNGHNFGSNSLLDGQSFTASFIYDTAIGRYTSPELDQVAGGLSHGNQSPIISASIRMNGIEFFFPGRGLGVVSITQGYSVLHSAQDPIYDSSIYLTKYLDEFDNPLNLLSTFTVLGNDILPPGFIHQGFAAFGKDEAILSIRGLKVANVSAVPLPAGLPLLLSGIMALGLAWRRGRTSAHAG